MDASLAFTIPVEKKKIGKKRAQLLLTLPRGKEKKKKKKAKSQSYIADLPTPGGKEGGGEEKKTEGCLKFTTDHRVA